MRRSIKIDNFEGWSFPAFFVNMPMLLLPDKNPGQNSGTIILLEKEIATLEAELLQLESSINTFQSKIRAALSTQIRKIHALTNLYKTLKQAKKLKRLEQKKRGKNYKETVGLKGNNASFTTQKLSSAEDKQEMKRLFKEAIVQIHPDKLTDANENLNKRATDVTAKLNEVYQNGDLEEMSRLHEHILSGNALNYVADKPETVKDFAEMAQFLQQKKQKLQELLQEIKSSGIYGLFTSGKNLDQLILELKTQFEERIAILEKRIK